MHTLRLRHLERVTEVFMQTGTFWENYAPELSRQGTPAQKDFVGRGGVGSIAVLLEYVLGLRPDFPGGTLAWDVRPTEAHGIE